MYLQTIFHTSYKSFIYKPNYTLDFKLKKMNKIEFYNKFLNLSIGYIKIFGIKRN